MFILTIHRLDIDKMLTQIKLVKFYHYLYYYIVPIHFSLSVVF